MDNVSHSLTGLMLAQAGLRRFSPAASGILIVSANAPDMDIVALAGGSLRYLEAHRGYTHSLLLLPFMALLSVLLVAVVSRRKLPWARAWLLGCVGIASHLLLDWSNSYGIRLLLPFSSRWFHLDWNSLYDGFFLAALIVSALWPLLANLVGGEIGDRSSHGRGIALLALGAISVFECGRVALHDRATANLAAHVYGEEQPLQVAALPDPFNPFRWEGVVETESAFLTVPTTTAGEPELSQTQTFYKPPQAPVVSTLKKEESFRFVSYFARFPVWSLVPVEVNSKRAIQADLSDLRFGVPGGGSFHCFGLVDGANHVLESYFSWAGPDRATER